MRICLGCNGLAQIQPKTSDLFFFFAPLLKVTNHLKIWNFDNMAQGHINLLQAITKRPFNKTPNDAGILNLNVY